MVMAVSRPIICVDTIMSASDWVGFTLPGMIDEPGSFSGSISSPRPQRGPEPIQRISFAILNSVQPSRFIALEHVTQASLVLNAAKGFSCGVNVVLDNSESVLQIDFPK